MAKTIKEYGNDSIKKLEGPDRVANALRLFLVRTDLMAVSIRFLK